MQKTHYHKHGIIKITGKQEFDSSQVNLGRYEEKAQNNSGGIEGNTMNEKTHNTSSNVQAKDVFHDILDDTTFDFSDENTPEDARKKKAKDPKHPKRQADNVLPGV